MNRLRHRRSTLPELAGIKKLMQQRASILERYTAAETRVGDLTEDQRQAESDLQPVRDRRTRDQEKLDSGSVGDPKALRGLQSELESLDRRISNLEDAELEIMESLEQAQSEFEGLKGERREIEVEIRGLMATRDEQFAEIDTDLKQQEAAREKLVGTVPAELLALYTKVAERNGTGAAEVQENRCSGCHLDLDPVEVQQLQAAAADDVVRCEECGRVLVR